MNAIEKAVSSQMTSTKYYWKGSNFRLTMLRDAILRKSEVTLALEDIYNASMPISDAKCENVTYANSN
ncbi:hypothetical protein ECZC05_53380 [Escherichia coli]|nr:hypothetical protein ECZC05_53380 [Escherichia coli]